MSDVVNYPHFVLQVVPGHRKGCSLWHVEHEIASCGCSFNALPRFRPEPKEWR